VSEVRESWALPTGGKSIVNLLSFIILCVLLWGRSLRFKNLRWHIRLVLLAMAADLSLVAVLVILREAVAKVGVDMPWTLKLHIPVAILTVVLYFFTAWAGYQLYRGRNTRKRLRYLDRVLIPARILTLVTSLMVQFIKV
jgi:hypothetical protein